MFSVHSRYILPDTMKLNGVTGCRFPNRWIRDGLLAELRWYPHSGDATAALLVLLALCIALSARASSEPCDCDGLATEPDVQLTAVRLNYSQLMQRTAITRAKVGAGLALLRVLGLVDVTFDGRKAIYSVPQLHVPGDWCLFPALKVQRLHVLQPHKGLRLHSAKQDLRALALYVALLARSDDGRDAREASYARVSECTRMRPTEFVQAVDRLTELKLLRLAPYESPESQCPVCDDRRKKFRNRLAVKSSMASALGRRLHLTD